MSSLLHASLIKWRKKRKAMPDTMGLSRMHSLALSDRGIYLKRQHMLKFSFPSLGGADRLPLLLGSISVSAFGTMIKRMDYCDIILFSTFQWFRKSFSCYMSHSVWYCWCATLILITSFNFHESHRSLDYIGLGITCSGTTHKHVGRSVY